MPKVTPHPLTPLTAADGPAVAGLWERAGPLGHPLGRDAWHAWWDAPDGGLAWGVYRGAGELVGVLLARAPTRPWAPAELAHIALLAVDPAWRRQGIGGALWRHAIAELHARGRARLRLGAEPERLFPGVPVGVPAATWRFLRHRGVVPGGVEVDLWLDLDDAAVARATLPDGVRLRSDAEAEGLAFVAHHFPGRWSEEVASAVALGAMLLTLHQRARVVGFALARPPHPPLAAASLTWTALAPWGSLDPHIAGLGPLGIAPEVRGEGLGVALVAAAARALRASGATAAIIDWTTLTGFYGRLGARVWRAYQRAEGGLVSG
jgi:ribosomal protein S18 acetylase RimI-like enzyme